MPTLVSFARLRIDRERIPRAIVDVLIDLALYRRPLIQAASGLTMPPRGVLKPVAASYALPPVRFAYASSCPNASPLFAPPGRRGGAHEQRTIIGALELPAGIDLRQPVEEGLNELGRRLVVEQVAPSRWTGRGCVAGEATVMRPGWDEYFMEVARTVATRATCPRASVGAILVREQRILTTGYNGAPRHVAHCSEVGCEMVGGHCVRSTHAEANAVVQGALHGVGLEGSTAYCTHQPCVHCAKLLISAGIARIVYAEAYPDAFAQQLLAEAGVALAHFATLERAGVGSGA